MGFKRPISNLDKIAKRIEKKRAKERARSLLPRCNATDGLHVCEREIGHGNGWNGDKHRQGGFTWTDAYTKRASEEQPS
jgi:hypothetical protein